jgi:hypothetical protein
MPLLSKFKRRIPDYLVFLFSLGFLGISYYAYHHFHYVSAPGGDLYNHAEMVKQLQTEGLSIFFDGYPKLFHLFVLFGMKLTGRDALWVMLGYVPIVVVGSGLIISTLLKRLSDGWVGLLGFVLAVLVAQQPLQTLYDGGFPNFINTMLWLPLVMLGLSYVERPERRRKGIVLTVLGALLMVLTHHFSALYLGILLLAGLFFLPGRWRKYAGFILVVGILVLVSPIGSGAQGLLSQVVQFGHGFPWVHLIGHLDNPNALLQLRSYPDYFTPIIWWGGLATMVGVVVAWVRKIKIPLPITMLTVLGAVLLVCSQVEAFGFPIRLARDAGMPLLVLTAYGVGVCVKAARKTVFTTWLAPIIILGVCIAMVTPIHNRIHRLKTFEPTMQYTPAQATMVRKTNGQPAIYIDSLLVTAVNPSVVARYSVEGPNSSVVSVPGISYILIDQNNQYFPEYEQIFAAADFHFIGEAGDPARTVRLYGK